MTTKTVVAMFLAVVFDLIATTVARDVAFIPGCMITEPEFDSSDSAHTPGDLYLFQECLRTAYNNVYSNVGPHYYTISSVDFWDEDEVNKFVEVMRGEEGEAVGGRRRGLVVDDEEDEHYVNKLRKMRKRKGKKRRGALGVGGKCKKRCRDRDVPLPSFWGYNDDLFRRDLMAASDDVSDEFTACVKLEQAAGYLQAYAVPLEGISVEKCGE